MKTGRADMLLALRFSIEHARVSVGQLILQKPLSAPMMCPAFPNHHDFSGDTKSKRIRTACITYVFTPVYLLLCILIIVKGIKRHAPDKAAEQKTRRRRTCYTSISNTVKQIHEL